MYLIRRTSFLVNVPIETIYGQLQGLKPSQLKQLQRLYHQRLPGDCMVTAEFAQRLAAISTEIDQPVCAYVNRRGQVIRVGVGTPRQTQIPPLELPRYGGGRLSGIRCLSTQFEGEPPRESALTAMAVQRLDILVVLILTGEGFQRRGGGGAGYVRDAYLAYLTPKMELEHNGSLENPLAPIPYYLSAPLSVDELSKQNFLDLVDDLEGELQREFVARAVDTGQDKVLLVGVKTDNLSTQRFETGLSELARLVDTAGGLVLDALRQKRSHLHPQTVVGSGKVQEIALTVQTVGANLVVFDRDLSPAQVRNLEVQIGVRVVDRTELILDIFAQRAQSGAGKLQVELAQLEYSLPRLTGRGQAMSRLGGGIGTRGPGETKLETERRGIQRRIARLQQEVNQLQAHRSRLRERRHHQDVPTLAIVGYTNAGKSTLLNILTRSQIYAADQLFATLDPTSRRLTVPHAVTGEPLTVVLTDTVGFIHELPPALMDAFRATLEEVSDADGLIHVVDLSHPSWRNHIESVMQILMTLPITPGPAILAFNKIDQADGESLQFAREEYPQSVFISAGNGLGLETLRQRVGQLVNYVSTLEE